MDASRALLDSRSLPRDAFLAHDSLLDSVSSRNALYGDMQSEVAALEARVGRLGDDATTEEILAAVESLRNVRSRAQVFVRPPLQRPQSAPPKRSEGRQTWRCTTPEPFSNLEADVQRRLRRQRESDAMAADMEEREATARARAKASACSASGFALVEKHQAEQENRAALARAARARLIEEELACSQFKAKPILYDSKAKTWEERCAEDDIRRSERIQRRAERKLASTAPILAKSNVRSREATATGCPNTSEIRSVRPEPAEVVQRLDEAHDRWCRALERAKSNGRSRTIARPFFERRAAERAERAAQREQHKLARQTAVAAAARETERAARQRHLAACRRGSKINAARHTYSTYLRVQVVREKEQSRREAERREIDMASVREARLRDAAKRIHRELRDEDIRREHNANELRLQAASRRDAWRRALKENKQHYQTVAKQAPSLITRLKIQTAKEKARVKALKRIAKLVYGVPQSDWVKLVDDIDIFTDEEKVFLNLAPNIISADDDAF